MKIVFIRHGKTVGNLEKRYIGRTDEPLCKAGKNELLEKKYPPVDKVICSPMKRCIETARLIYPNKKISIYDNLRECNFGDFEGKNYTELNDNSEYQRWLDSGGTLPFPNGEDTEQFKKRCIAAFIYAVRCCKNDNAVAFVVHGGTIMSVFETLAMPKKNYFDYQVKNGCGYITEYDGAKIDIAEEI